MGCACSFQILLRVVRVQGAGTAEKWLRLGLSMTVDFHPLPLSRTLSLPAVYPVANASARIYPCKIHMSSMPFTQSSLCAAGFKIKHNPCSWWP